MPISILKFYMCNMCSMYVVFYMCNTCNMYMCNMSVCNSIS